MYSFYHFYFGLLLFDNEMVLFSNKFMLKILLSGEQYGKL